MDHLLEKYGFAGAASSLKRRLLPALAFSLAEQPVTRSVFGGAPLVPSKFEWPTYTARPNEYPPGFWERVGRAAPNAPTARGLDFLLQIDLADLASFALSNDLPKRGLLTFFYDAENQPWGFDPAHREGWRVELFDGDDLITRLPPGAALPRKGLKFWKSETLPHFGSRAYDQLEREVELPEAYFELVHELEREHYPTQSGLHRLLGHPVNIQGDMQLEAQLVSNGIQCGHPSGYHDSRAKELEAGADDWLLLLQLDSDDRVSLMWGDVGMLYFSIRRQDLAARRFDRVWVEWQSH